MKKCIFCSIVNGAIPAKIIYEDDNCIIFNDISPRAEKHYLAIPKTHYPSLAEMPETETQKLAQILKTIPALAEKLGLQNGYRLVINQGADAGQTVFHLHIHIMGGQELDFPDLRNI